MQISQINKNGYNLFYDETFHIYMICDHRGGGGGGMGYSIQMSIQRCAADMGKVFNDSWTLMGGNFWPNLSNFGILMGWKVLIFAELQQLWYVMIGRKFAHFRWQNRIWSGINYGSCLKISSSIPLPNFKISTSPPTLIPCWCNVLLSFYV